MNDIIFITAYKDIGRSKWDFFTRSNDEYYNYFYNLATNIKYTLIVYIDNITKTELEQKYSFNSNIVFKDINTVNTFYKKYIEIEEKIINDIKFKEKIPQYRKHCPETRFANYNLINHSKINFVSHTKKLYPNYKFYSWLDFGGFRSIDSSIPKNINIDILPKKIIFQTLTTKIINYIDANEMLKYDDVFICGSIFIIYTELVELYEKKYEQILNNLQKNYIVDDDQSVVLQVYFNNKELFYLIYNEKWFELFSILNN